MTGRSGVAERPLVALYTVAAWRMVMAVLGMPGAVSGMAHLSSRYFAASMAE